MKRFYPLCDSLGKTGEGNLKGRPAKPGSPGRA